MIKSIALIMASSIFASGALAAPAPAQSEPEPDALKMLQETMVQLGKDARHPYVIPYCGGEPISISTLDAGYLPKSDEAGTVSLPDNIEVLMIDIPTPIDMSPYDNTLGALVIDMQFPPENPDWASELNITGLLFTSNSSAPFDSVRLSSSNVADRISLNMAFSFLTTFNNSGVAGTDENEGPIYTLITSPYVKVPITDNSTLAQTGNALGAPSLEQTGKYLVELGFMMSKGDKVNVSDIMFSDMYLMCLPYPTLAELEAQNITFWKNETSPGVFELSPALAAATRSH